MHQLSEQAALDARKRPVRVLSLLDSLARAAISPVTVRVLHELAYLTNVLAPVFDLPPFSASLLRRRGGPYYPELQETVDLLVGRRMVDVADIRYVYDTDEGRYRLDANYRLNDDLAADAVLEYRRVYAHTSEPLFIDELAAAYSLLADDQLGGVARYDARYGDENVDTNDVIDFGQWSEASKTNFSRNSALSFRPGERLNPAERLYMYMAHVQRRAAGGR